MQHCTFANHSCFKEKAARNSIHFQHVFANEMAINMLMFDKWHPIILFQMSVLQEPRWGPRSAVERLNISDMSEWYFKMKNASSFGSSLQSKDGRRRAFGVSERWRARSSAGSSCWGHSCHRLNNARGSGLHVQNRRKSLCRTHPC